jgi:hypothetical protein
MSIAYVGRVSPPLQPVPPEGALYWDYINGNLYGSLPSSGEWVLISDANAAQIPVVTASVQASNTTVVQGTAITAPAGAPTMYAVSIYLKAVGTASAGHKYTETLTYTAADGSGTQTITLILPLDSANVVMETYPLLILAGSSLVATGAYGGGATDDPYTISMRIVSMPLAG